MGNANTKKQYYDSNYTTLNDEEIKLIKDKYIV